MSKVARIVSAAVLFAAAATLLQAGTFNDLATFQANTSGLTLINFDVDPGSNPLAATTSLVGVYTAIGVDFLEGDYVAVAGGPVSTPNGWFNNDFVEGKPFFRANFNFNAGSVTAVGIHHVLASAPVVDLTAYDAGGNPLGTVASDGDGETTDFFGVTTGSSISYFTVVWRTTADGWGLDDLYFGSADGDTGTPEVPEPGSLGLASAGILAGILALAARRR